MENYYALKLKMAGINTALDSYNVFCSCVDLGINGVDITAKEGNEDHTPICWDAGFGFDGDNFIIEGSVAGHGFGKVKIELPVKEVDCFYNFTIEVEGINLPAFIKLVTEYNIEIENMETCNC